MAKKPLKKIGLPPGTLVYTGEKTDNIKISVIDYDEHHYEEKEAKNIRDCVLYKEKPSVTWINIDGIHQVEPLREVGECFNIDSLVLEDIMNTEHRPKIEDFGDYLFLVLKMFYYDEKVEKITVEQVSFILSSRYLISFQEQGGDVFDGVRARIREGKGRIRKMGSDYLLYSLMDAIVDNYFTVLDKIGEKIESIDESVIQNPTAETLQVIYSVKRDIIFLRKTVWPLREAISQLDRGESKLVKKTTGVYLRDVYEHTIQVIDTIESFRDTISGMLDIYMTSISNRMNEVMKVLTIIATIFIPLTFIAGVYGMNFENMPELAWEGGYFMALFIMLAVSISMVIYFKRKKWL